MIHPSHHELRIINLVTQIATHTSNTKTEESKMTSIVPPLANPGTSAELDPASVTPTSAVDSTQTIQVILIEDDAVDAEIVHRSLRMAAPGEFTIEHVRSLSEAIPRLSRYRYDAILLDLGLQDCSSLEAVDSLVSFIDSPIVVLTGNEDQEIASRAVEIGAQDFLQKSENLQEILPRTIKFSIQRYQIQRDLARTEKLLAKQSEWERQANLTLRQRIAVLEPMSAFAESTRQFAAILNPNGIEWANEYFRQFLNETHIHQIPEEGFLDLPAEIECQFLSAFRSASAFSSAWIDVDAHGTSQCKRIELFTIPNAGSLPDSMGFTMTIDPVTTCE